MNWSAVDVADVPPTVVTVTSTVPVPAGDVTVSEVAELTVTPVAAMVPNLTAGHPGEVGAGDGHPVPPVAGPLVGLTAVTVGAAT